MTRLPMLAAAAVAALAAAACAGSATTDSAATSATQSSASQSSATAQTSSYTDAELSAYMAAKNEIEPLQTALATQTPEQQTQTRTQIAAILQRHNLTATQFNGITAMAIEDRTFASRLAALAPDTFTDATLQAFAAASVEIDPISRNLATATPEQRTQATEQIREILQRHNLDSATYNAIAARAQTDQALAARIASLRSDTPSG